MDTIIFEDGLFGFEASKVFVPVSFEEGSDAMMTLHSADTEGLSFVVMNPFLLQEDYKPEVDEKELQSLGELKEGQYSWYVICVPKEPVGDSTVNLRCPIVVNTNTKKAKQVILDNRDYSLRHTLKELTRKEQESC